MTTATAATSAASTTTVSTRRDRAAFVRIRPLARAAGSIMDAIGSRWNGFVDAGQLGPSTEVITSRHTGARI